jgi:hypothetical protein
VSQDDEENLDEEFPEGDGTAQTEATVMCPYCSEEVEIVLDPGSGPSQLYIEDCEVCCQPWRVSVSYDGGGAAEVVVTALDE